MGASQRRTGFSAALKRFSSWRVAIWVRSKTSLDQEPLVWTQVWHPVRSGRQRRATWFGRDLVS
jgi:hypothetical protein